MAQHVEIFATQPDSLIFSHMLINKCSKKKKNTSMVARVRVSKMPW